MRFGFIGLGDMGLPMARRLLATGQGLVAWNRSPDSLGTLAGEGAIAAASPAQVMAGAEVVGLCLTSHQAVEAVAFGDDGLFAAPDVAGRTVVDFSTGAPDAAQGFAARAAGRGAAWVDAPVSGGVPAAVEGRLTIFLGGEADAVAAARPMLDAVAARTTHMGPSGAGQTTKLCNQMIVAGNLLIMAETFAMARRAGVDVERLPEALKGGFADSSPLQIFGPRMAGGVFTPRLGAIALMSKDVGLIRRMASAAGARAPMLELAADLYGRVGQPGLPAPEEDLSALIRLFEAD